MASNSRVDSGLAGLRSRPGMTKCVRPRIASAARMERSAIRVFVSGVGKSRISLRFMRVTDFAPSPARGGGLGRGRMRPRRMDARVEPAHDDHCRSRAQSGSMDSVRPGASARSKTTIAKPSCFELLSAAPQQDRFSGVQPCKRPRNGCSIAPYIARFHQKRIFYDV